MTATSTAFAFLAIAPGRVNLLGEHVDYNDGPVLPAAIDRTVQVRFSPAEGNRVSIRALDLGKLVEFQLDQVDTKKDIDGNPLTGWALYPAGVASVLQQAGYTVKGMEAEFTSNVPMGSGLSSSAAVEVAFMAAWNHLGRVEMERIDSGKVSPKSRECVRRSQLRINGSIRLCSWCGSTRAFFQHPHPGVAPGTLASFCSDHHR